ncbi:hypothetical protein D3C73_1287570 [compost metagenome]
MRIGGTPGNKDFLLGVSNDANGDVQMFHRILLIDPSGHGLHPKKTGAQHAEPLGFIG